MKKAVAEVINVTHPGSKEEKERTTKSEKQNNDY